MDTYISKIDDPVSLVDTFIPPLFEAILGDYHQNVEQAKDAEVLNVTTTAFIKFGSLLSVKVSPVLDAVFEGTLAMISRDFTQYPDHRQGFFRLIAAINTNCFAALIQLNPRYFKLIMDSIVWAFKHSMRDIADIGLIICLDLLKNIVSQSNATVTCSFFKTYYVSLLQDIFFVLTDSSQKSGFRYQAEILAFLFQIISQNMLTVPLNPHAIDASTPADNLTFVREFVIGMLRSGFPNLQAYFDLSYLFC